MPWIEARGDRARLTPHRAAVWRDENRLRNSYRRHCYLLWYFETVREGGGGSDAYGRSPTRRGCGGAGSARPLKARRRADRHRWSPYSRQEVKCLAVRKAIGKILFWYSGVKVRPSPEEPIYLFVLVPWRWRITFNFLR